MANAVAVTSEVAAPTVEDLQAQIETLKDQLADAKATSFNNATKVLTIGALGAKMDLFQAKGKEKVRGLIRAACPSANKVNGTAAIAQSELVSAAETCLWLAGMLTPNAKGNVVTGRHLRSNETQDIDGNFKAIKEYRDDRLS